MRVSIDARNRQKGNFPRLNGISLSESSLFTTRPPKTVDNTRHGTPPITMGNIRPIVAPTVDHFPCPCNCGHVSLHFGTRVYPMTCTPSPIRRGCRILPDTHPVETRKSKKRIERAGVSTIFQTTRRAQNK